jgi:hypothetical protein
MADYVDANIEYKKLGVNYFLPQNDHGAVVGEVELATAGAGLSLMDLVMRQADGKYDPSDADAEGTANGLLGIVLSSNAGSLVDTDRFVLVLEGWVRDDTWNFTVGADLFVSATAGEITETAPAGGGDVVRRVGHAVSADVIYFHPDNHYEVV